MNSIPDHICVGDEPLTREEEERRENKAESARKSHSDGSHVYRQLTYVQRLELGSMLREMAGDI